MELKIWWSKEVLIIHSPKSLFHVLKESYLVLYEICTQDSREVFPEELILTWRYDKPSNAEFVK